MIKESFYRFFKRKRFFFTIFIIILINLVDILPRRKAIIFNDKLIVQSSFLENIMINGSLGNAIIMFVFLSFILASLPMADSFVEDRESGIYKTYMLKITDKEYTVKKFLINFVYAGLSVSLVLLINIAVWLLLRPSLPITYYNTTFNNDLFLIKLIVKSPLLFYLASIFIDFIIGGIIGSFAMFLNDIFKSKYLGIGGVFILDIILDLLMSILRSRFEIFNNFLSLSSFLNGVIIKHSFSSFIYPLLLFLISCLYFLIFKKNKEII
ncbi:hypothetical protein HV819_05385 [Anaerococcus sp. AGMB00486]|uniref:ABC transporter permease n=2 Tax=Anaerococcus TaxID=165779 RepID=A0ABX2N9P4_9FIRM|nr:MULTISPECIES: hypothetical protein [Anaerococcus]MDY3005637.1 hypothetical protein [Anaerococcus porci]MSS78306.1 hypothetical protein [Anaerococcus porci]NVF11419.1 hypothetical protein [Anaerococcus faecalis]